MVTAVRFKCFWFVTVLFCFLSLLFHGHCSILLGSILFIGSFILPLLCHCFILHFLLSYLLSPFLFCLLPLCSWLSLFYSMCFLLCMLSLLTSSLLHVLENWWLVRFMVVLLYVCLVIYGRMLHMSLTCLLSFLFLFILSKFTSIALWSLTQFFWYIIVKLCSLIYFCYNFLHFSYFLWFFMLVSFFFI